jgi:hypothetical protein
MATFQLFPARRLILAGGFAVAIAVAPMAAGMADPAPQHSVAACTSTNSSNGSYALQCAPDVAPPVSGGAPSESDLTAINAQRGFRR